ncbi:MAG: sugar dehydrogenase complex small subunit [Sneathiellaceae bacterium]
MTEAARAGIDRRAFVTGGFALGAALFLGGLPAARAAMPLPPLPGGVLDGAAFLALSTRLTGHDDLDEDLGRSLRAALTDAGHGTGLVALYGAVAKAAPDDEAAIAAAAAGQDAAARALLRGWYVGLVRMPDGSDRLVGYEDVLMGAVLADVIPLRSFCGGDPHFWAEPPDLDDLPLRPRG